jgi:hypothetical protein
VGKVFAERDLDLWHHFSVSAGRPSALEVDLPHGVWFVNIGTARMLVIPL